MNFIDTHQHVIYRDRFDYSWTQDIPALATGDFTFEDYRELARDDGVLGTIFMEVDVGDAAYHAEARFVGGQVGRNGLLGQIASCRPETDAGFDAWLEEGSSLGVLGYRRILHEVPDDVSRSETFRANVAKIHNAGRTFDMVFLARQLPIARELARACDGHILVLDHCGVPDIAGGGFESWADGIRRIAELEHVVVKLSGITAYCAPGQHGVEVLRPWVEVILEAFGPKRMVWGSDWPVVNLGAGLSDWIGITRQLLADLSPDEQAAITEKNARWVYGLDSVGLGPVQTSL